jgi:hypothetical protein
VNYQKEIKLPGSIKFNASIAVSKQLPEDWNIELNMKIEMPFLGWVDVPCPGWYCHTLFYPLFTT